MPDLLSKEAILAGRPLKTAYVKAFGGRVKVTELTVAQRDKLDVLVTKVSKERDEETARSLYTSYWIAFATVDDAGERVFADKDLDAIAALPVADVRRVYRTIAKLNGIGEDDDAEESAGNP